MALISKIRKRSGLLIIIVGVALASFVLGDFLNPRKRGTGSRGEYILADIEGEEITITQFNEKAEQNIEIQKRNRNTENLTQTDIFNVKQQTWNQLLNEILLGKECEKLGLVVSKDEHFDLVQGKEPHPYILQYFKDPKTNQYDPVLVQNYLRNLDQLEPDQRNQWIVFEKAIKDDRLLNKYRNLIAKGYYMPEIFLSKDFEEKQTMNKIRLFGVNFNSIADSTIKVTEEELKKYYEDYKFNYDQEASRDLDYLVFEVTPSEDDKAKLNKEINNIYAEFQTTENVAMFVNSVSDESYDSTFHKKGELPPAIDTALFDAPAGTFLQPFLDGNIWKMAKLIESQARPDSMKASHILISYAGAAGAGEKVKRTKDEAKLKSDSLFAAIKKSPGLLEELAKKVSDDPSAKDNAGDMKWFADGAMVYPFNNAVLKGKVGDIVTAETQFGYHVIKITGKKDPVKKIRVAVISRKSDPSNETFQEIYAKASEFAGKCKSVESFDTISASMGMTKRTANYIMETSYMIAGLEYARPIVQWSFMDGVETGTVSPVFDMNGQYVVVVVTKTREKGIPELEDMKEVLEPLVIKKKKAEIMFERVKKEMNTTKDLVQLAAKFGSKVDTLPDINFHSRSLGMYGPEYEVFGRLSTFKPNVMYPVKGDNAAFVVVVDQVTKPDMKKADLNNFKMQMLLAFRSKANNNSFYTMLSKKADLKDNRIKFY